MATSVKGKMHVWDVVNEVMADSGEQQDGDGVRTQFGGSSLPVIEYDAMGQAYIDKAFHWAAAADPDAILILNDYGMEDVNAKSTNALNFAIKMRNRGVPIHGIGFQCHFFEMIVHATPTAPNYNSIRQNFQRFADAGFRIYITEFDVPTLKTTDPANNNPDQALLNAQRDIFEEILKICLEQPMCKSFLMWDFADDQSWLHPLDNGFANWFPSGTYSWPTAFWGGDWGRVYDITPKPAYYGMQEVLRDHQAVVRLNAGWEYQTAYLTRDGSYNGVGWDPGEEALTYFSLIHKYNK